MARTITPTGYAASARGASSTLSLFARISTWLKVANERRALAALSADRLQDIGLSEHGAALEAARPFWDAPSRA